MKKRSRILAWLLVGTLVVSNGAPVQAASLSGDLEEEKSQEELLEEESLDSSLEEDSQFSEEEEPEELEAELTTDDGGDGQNALQGPAEPLNGTSRAGTAESVLAYDMEVEDGKLKDASGNLMDGTLVDLDEGDVNTYNGVSVLDLDGSGYVELPEGIVNGEELTVDITAATTVANAQWLWTLGEDNWSYTFFTPSNGAQDTKFTISKQTPYNGTGAWQTEQSVAVDAAALDGSYQTYTLVWKEDSLALYVEGVKVGETEQTHGLMNVMPESSRSGYIGKSLYNEDPLFKGKVARVDVYSGALTDEEIGEMAEGVDKSAYVKTDIYSAMLGENASADAVTGNLSFPSQVDGSEITWSVQEGQNVVASDGTITRPQQDTTVEVTASFQVDEEEVTETFRITVKPVNQEEVEELAKELTLPYSTEEGSEVYGNITLPETVNGKGSVTWETDHPEIVDVESHENDGAYADIPTPAGVVTRPDKDTEVTMTATVTMGEASVQKDFTFTVKAAPEELDPCEAYLFAHFTGTENNASVEQIYFAGSEDGNHWKDLNDRQPVLTSEIGDKGVRDPFLVRSAEGDKFYLIATDLSIYHRGGWGNAQATTTGSTDLVVWESTDLVNWSEPWLADVASRIPGAGCAWAPEAFYDENTGEYVVYWATGSDESNDLGDRMNVYYAKTRDFRTFTEPVKWIDRQNSIIDTTMIQANGKYYRASGDGQITIDESDSIFGEWKTISTLKDIFNTDRYSGAKLEGPELFLYNEADWEVDEEGNPVETWGLMCDQYSESKGYLPFRTTNIADTTTDSWRTADEVNFGSLKKRHGTILPVTAEEYEAILEAYSKDAPENTDPAQEDPIAEYTFEEGEGDLTLNGKAAIKEEGGNHYLYLDGSSGTFAEFPEGFLDGRNQMTISMDLMTESTNGNFFTFAFGRDTNEYYFLRQRGDELYSAITQNTYSGEASVTAENISYGSGTWNNVKIVLDQDQMRVYVNDVLVGENQKTYVKVSELGEDLKAYLGKSFYSADGYFKGGFDNIQIYNRALTEEEITGAQEEVPLLASYDFSKTEGTTVKDQSGKGNDGEIRGSNYIVDGKNLTLPGGANGSNAAYVELPGSLFAGKKELTISAWLKNETGSGNYSAMFFGTPKNQNNVSSQYWLLNPKNPSGTLKSVITNSADEKYPYNTEYGISPTNSAQGIKGPETDSEWGLYTTVLTEDSITAYYNGEKVGTAAIQNPVSNFGSDLVAYIGKSTYPDMFYKGGVRDVKVWDGVYTDQDVEQLYEDAVFDVAMDTLSFRDGDSVYSSLKLPETLIGKVDAVWSSGNPEVLANDGTVTRPELGEKDASVDLRVNFTTGTLKKEVIYHLTVKALSEEEIAQSLVIPKYISENLPSEINGMEVTYESDDPKVIGKDGTVTFPEAGEGSKTVAITATVGTVEIKGEAEVLEKGGDVVTYVTKGGDLLAYADSRRSDALFVAAKNAEGNYEELNKGKAILYVKWQGDQKVEENWQMGSPEFFRFEDGSLGVIASANNGENGVYIWNSKDTVNFENQRYLTLAETGTQVQDPSLVYDAATQNYKIFWQDQNGGAYVSVFESLENGSKPEVTYTAYITEEKPDGELPEEAVAEEAGGFSMSAAEYELFQKKYGTLHNTGVDSVEVSVEEGEELNLPDTVTAHYSDGTEKNLGVKWDEEALKEIDTSESGTYTIEGEVQQDAFSYPFIAERADPHVFYNEDDGYYYSTGSYYPVSDPQTWGFYAGDCYRAIGIRRAKTLGGLQSAEEHLMFDPDNDPDAQWGTFLWAPEFHKINGTWYCLVGASRGKKAPGQYGWCSNSVLIPYIGDGDDSTSLEEDIQAGGMLDKNQWGDPIILEGAPSFDVSYYEDENGQGYYVLPNTPGGAQISIVKAKSEGVPQFDGEKVMVKTIEFPWEYGIYEGSVSASNPEGTDQGVVEGPYLFSYGDKVYISYSGATVDKYYCLGLMVADKGSDIMDPDSWTNVNYPLLSSYDTADGQIGGASHMGGGHNSVVVDEYGNLALIYHARPNPDPHEGKGGAGGLFDPCRNTMVKSINVAYDGTLVFNMTPEEELDPRFKTVTATITVEGNKTAQADFQKVMPEVTAEVGADSSVTVEWKEIEHAASYRIYRKEAGGSFRGIANVDAGATTYVDKAAEAGKTYYYTVKGFWEEDAKGICTKYPTDVSVKIPVKELATPSVKTRSVNYCTVEVTWNKITGADKYVIYRKEAKPGTAFKSIGTVGGGTLSYRDGSAKMGVNYYYTVKAFAGSIYSDYQKTVTGMAVPSSPTLKAAGSSKGVTITWTGSKAGDNKFADGYRVFRKTEGGSWKTVGTVGANTRSFTDTTGAKGTTYVYTVRAYVKQSDGTNLWGTYNAAGVKGAKK
ncbi:MAG TPA: family 43 glycosylhydrolase [Candidatus Blautia avistercoris]|nr:family 43 glycosylhydrolase [Candidatus Blautia avistercoris]